MAAAGTSPALNLREKLAELAGLKQRVSPDLVRCDFTNLVTNGGFDTDVTSWTANGSGDITFSAVSGVMEIVRGAGSTAGLPYQAITTVIGKRYKLTGTVSGAGVVVRADPSAIAGGGYGSLTTSGSIEFVATTTTAYVAAWGNASTTVSIDNITLYEADPSDDAPWLRLPYGYKVGTRGMIVRDGVILHPSDYTEITDSGQTFIKPIVAPGASTEFSIWAGA